MDAIKTLLKPKLITSVLDCRLLLYALLGGITLISGCNGNSKTEKEVDKVASAISNQIVDQTNKLSEWVPSRNEIKKSSTEQIEKTFAIEYKVVDFHTDTTSEQIQKILSDLGKERWDCFSINTSFDSSKLLCKRRPISALRTIIEAGGLLW